MTGADLVLLVALFAERARCIGLCISDVCIAKAKKLGRWIAPLGMLKNPTTIQKR
jgi:hypothetical protein